MAVYGSVVVKEPTFTVSDFNSPKEVENADMWIELICQLIFLEKGTYSDSPDIGVDITKYEYSDIIRDTSKIELEIRDQINNYLSDIPIGVLTVKPYYWAERNIHVLRVIVGFIQGSVTVTRAIDITDMGNALSYIIRKYDDK